MKRLFFLLLILTLTVGTAYSGIKIKNMIKGAAVSSTSAAFDETLAFMPDSDFVIIIDAGQLLNTKIPGLIGSDTKALKEFQDFEAEALKYGVDVRQLRQMSVGVRSLGDMKTGNFFAIATGGFDREKILASIATQNEKVGLESEQYQGKTLYVVTPKSASGAQSKVSVMGQGVNIGKERFAMTFLKPDTVAVGDIDSVKRSLDIQAGKQQGILSNQQIAGFLSTTSSGALIRFAGVAPDKAQLAARNPQPEAKANAGKGKGKVLTNEELNTAPKNNDADNDPEDSAQSNAGGLAGGFEKMLESIKGGYGSLDFSPGLQLNTTLLIRSEGEAKQMSDGLNGLLGLGKSMLAGQAQKDPQQAKLLQVINQVNVSGAGRDVKITVDLSEQLLRELIDMMNAGQKKPAAKTGK